MSLAGAPTAPPVVRRLQRPPQRARQALSQGVHPNSLTHRHVSGLMGATPPSDKPQLPFFGIFPEGPRLSVQPCLTSGSTCRFGFGRERGTRLAIITSGADQAPL